MVMIPGNNTFIFHVGKDIFRWTVVLFIACLCIFLISCSSESDNDYEEFTITGRVAKGPISHASVTIYKIQSDGTRGELVAGPFLTDSNGDWTWKLPDSNSGPFEAVARGGRFKNEATKEEVLLKESDEMLGIIDPHESSSVAVTPLTHAILLASKYMKEYDVSLTIQEAVEQTISDATMAFGFNPTTERFFDPENIPDNATDEQKKYTYNLMESCSS
ncbi:MAG: hypothetical protein SVY10_15595 [Thermodesulfobacteriota bacterium]|nr:hypothetical protein [Thermodesulfobacteriota bacterium]